MPWKIVGYGEPGSLACDMNVQLGPHQWIIVQNAEWNPEGRGIGLEPA